MPTIMLIMHRKAIVQGLMNRLRDSPDLRLIYENNYDNAKAAINSYDPNVALIEVAESGPFDITYCLLLCKELRINTPGCKLLIMCSEQDEYNVKLVVDAKGKKQIDDFVFYDVTTDYLASKLISI
ncbi:MAG TPA: hypothetical protein VFD00_03600 [Thermoclostridium sp.]|nr:hypothetical protein [Thermoclostridium sp.]